MSNNMRLCVYLPSLFMLIVVALVMGNLMRIAIEREINDKVYYDDGLANSLLLPLLFHF